MTRRGKYPPEIREEAVRLVRAHRDQYESEWAAMTSVTDKFGATAETVRKWVRQADIDDGVVDGVSSAKRQQIKDLQGEVRELRRANEILKAASVCVAEPVCPEKGQDQGRDRRAAVLTDRAQWAAYQRVGKNSGAVARGYGVGWHSHRAITTGAWSGPSLPRGLRRMGRVAGPPWHHRPGKVRGHRHLRSRLGRLLYLEGIEVVS